MDASKPLKNARHEAFAQHLAQDKSQAEAYVDAGYKNTKAARANAARLIAKDSVRARVQHLKARAAEKALVSAEDIVRGLMREAKGQGPDTSSSARIAALKALGDYRGLWAAQKHEHTINQRDPSTMTLEEIEAELRELSGG